jgi:hypothetical protein
MIKVAKEDRSLILRRGRQTIRRVTARLPKVFKIPEPVRNCQRRVKKGSGLSFRRGWRTGIPESCENERICRAWHFGAVRYVVVIFAKQRIQVLPEALRISIQPETTFHKTGRRGLDCCLALDVLAENSKLAEYLERVPSEIKTLLKKHRSWKNAS